MNDDQFEGKWEQIKGKVREQWSKLTDDDVEQVKGKRENLLAKIQERYGDTKEAAEEQLAAFEQHLDGR